MDILNFSDIVENTALDGDKLKIEEIMDKPIIVTGFKITNSKYSHKGTKFCTKVQFYFEDDANEEHHIIFTGSSVIKEQLEELEEALDGKPCLFRTTVKQIGNYKSLT